MVDVNNYRGRITMDDSEAAPVGRAPSFNALFRASNASRSTNRIVADAPLSAEAEALSAKYRAWLRQHPVAAEKIVAALQSRKPAEADRLVGEYVLAAQSDEVRPDLKRQ